ncbi:arsenical-resistance protein ACR3 [Cystobasidium minutum MCA 4210]|uniref:arsenical-resistance protein ACR3 n=1 Tax=Cystobasidium minutum MCA 4210 TaxID=1397322 RepID=UPI0034CD7BDD|eukprot:jgi/Rhomi1/175687/fgenesh1_kg.12_\
MKHSKEASLAVSPTQTLARTDEAVATSDVSRLDNDSVEKQPLRASKTTKRLFLGLGWLDRLLAPLVLVFMIVGTAVGATTGDAIPRAFDQVQFKGVSFPIVIGLLVMMWPVLTKVQYERLPEIAREKKLWYQIGISLILNWVIGPFVMLAIAWATLPDLPEYRIGVILVGVARCIAMVMIWNQLAGGDHNYCAIIVVINSVLQIVLFAPMAIFFINVISGESEFSISYGTVAIDVLIYLGIPLVAGVVTRYGVWWATSRPWLETRFLPYFGPLALLGLLYTIFVLFAYQGNAIVNNLGPVFRTFVPMIVYFTIMWTGAFAFIFFLTRWKEEHFGYEMAVVQSFTAGSNNFELAIAVAIAVYGVGSRQALAATIGPLVEVPVLLSLTWDSLWLKRRLHWGPRNESRV